MSFLESLEVAVFGNQNHRPPGPQGGQFAPKEGGGEAVQALPDASPLKGKTKTLYTRIGKFVEQGFLNGVVSAMLSFRKLSSPEQVALGKHFGVKDGNIDAVRSAIFGRINQSRIEQKTGARPKYRTPGTIGLESAGKGTGVSPEKWKPPSKPWRKSSTRELAEKQFQKAFPHVRTDLNGVHIDLINEIMPHVYKLANQFPKTMKDLRYFGTFKTKTDDIPKSSYFGTNGRTVAVNYNDNIIGLNPAFYGKPDKLKEVLARDVAARHHPAGGDTAASTVIHEFYHAAEKSLEDADPGFARWQLANHTYDHAIAVSRYALKTQRELWAESGVIRETQPEHSWPAYTKMQDEIIKKHAGKI